MFKDRKFQTDRNSPTTNLLGMVAVPLRLFRWEVYEQILRIPYYVVFDRYTDRLRTFALQGERYQELNLESGQLWIPSLELGLGLWQGSYDGIARQWLRWLDGQGNWMPTAAEQREQERQRADQEKQRADRLAQKLRELGIDPDTLSSGEF